MQTTRRGILCALGLTLCSSLVAAGAIVGLRVHDGTTVPPAVLPASVDAPKPIAQRADDAVLAVGDRLKITFHETVDLSGGSTAGRASGVSVLRTFYQRMDLSGEYTIDQEGVVALPQIGKLRAKGLLPSELEAQLNAGLVQATGRPAQVIVAIQDRRPVYVIGAVRNPGAVKHVGHMMVLQVIALTGGIDRGLGNTAELIEGRRAQERAGTLTRQLKRLLARRARLEAEQRGNAAMKAPAQLIELAGKDGAESMLSAELTLLRLDRSRREQQQAEAAAGVSAVRKEIEAMRAKLLELDTQRQIQGEHLSDLRKLEGLATKASVIRTRGEVAEIEVRRQDIRGALAVAEARLAQAEGTVARLELDHAAELARSIATAEAEISDTRVALESAALLADALGHGSPLGTPAATAAQPVYEIVRHGQDGPTVLPAVESTRLLPDDVLKVSLEMPPQSAAAHVFDEEVSQETPSSAIR